MVNDGTVHGAHRALYMALNEEEMEQMTTKKGEGALGKAGHVLVGLVKFAVAVHHGTATAEALV